MTFEIWMNEVDHLFLDAFGMSRDDFPDNCYWNMFDGGASPQEAYEDTLEREGYSEY